MKRTALLLGAALAAAAAVSCSRRPAPQPEAPPEVTPDQPAQQPPPVAPDTVAPPPAAAPPGYQPPNLVPRPNEPLIRVGLVIDRDSALFSATGQFRVLDAGGGVLAIADAGKVWSVRAGDGAGRLYLYRPDVPDPIALAAPVVVSLEQDGQYVTLGGRRYRGELVLQRGTAGITVVNRLPLEQYLLSVVALELGFRAPSDREAVKAQAVAARSYAVRFRGRREALGFDVFPTDADQVYSGVESELPEVNAAVGSTVGEILTYQGQPIQALFHSTCGWSTESAAQVFQNREQVPYLRATTDRYGSGDRDFYCAVSPRFRWREEWDAASLTNILSQTLPAIVRAGASAGVGRVTDIRVGSTTPTGRVAELIVTSTTGTWIVPLGRVREALRTTAQRQLWSNMFQVHVEKNGGGELVKVTAAGGGYGHGVGMCQYGAVGRARNGWLYEQILSTYYDGARLERIY